MLKRLLQLLLAAVLIVSVIVAVQFRSWVAASRAQLEAESEVLETAAGPIEIARSGDTGPTVLLLHGTPGGYDQSLALGLAFNTAGYRTIALSRPGYLRTPLTVGRTPGQQADAYVALLDVLDIDQVAVLGMSGGGPSALEFAIRHPERCWALVDFMGVSRAAEDGEMLAARELEEGFLAKLAFSNFVGWLLSGVVHGNPGAVIAALVPDEESARRILADEASLDSFIGLAESALRLPELRNAGMRNDMQHFLAMEPLDFAAIRAPTLVLHGTADINVPLAMAELVAQEVPGAELVTIEGGDHFVALSHPEQVFTPLFAFLDRVTGR